MSDNVIIHTTPNSFAIRYHVGEGVYTMDAFVENKCAREFLEFAKELAKILQIEVKIQSVALSQGSVIQQFLTSIVNSPEAKLFGSFLIGLFAEPLKSCLSKAIDKLFEDKEMLKLLREEKKLQVELLKQQVESNNKLLKRQSNFYESSLQDESISAITFSAGTDDSSSKIVQRQQFPSYVDSSNELDPEIIDDASILIVSPVIVKTKGPKKPKWHGIYNNELISFSVLSQDFLMRAMTGEISFKNGCAIDCKLIVQHYINDEGEITRSSYAVEKVYNVTYDNKVIETADGRKRRAEKVLESQPDLFSQFDN